MYILIHKLFDMTKLHNLKTQRTKKLDLNNLYKTYF